MNIMNEPSNNKRIKLFILIGAIAALLIGIVAVILVLNRNEYVSRFDWIDKLCEIADITEFETDDPFFDDVDRDDENYKDIQAAVEADVIPITDKFKGDEPITGKFAVVTALRAVDEYKRTRLYEVPDRDDEDYIEYAIENGLIDESELNKRLSEERCDELFEAISVIIRGGDAVEDIKQDSKTPINDIKEDSTNENDIDEINEETTEEGFDFSEYAGTYRATEWSNDAYGGGQSLDDLVMDNKGIITGGGSYYSPNPYPVKEPISVEKESDGSYKCIVNEESNTSGDIIYIYPEGVVEKRFKDDENLVNSVYLRYVHIDGGVSDVVFYKIAGYDEVETVDTSGVKLDQHYTTKYGEINSVTCPAFSFDYPKNWKITSEEYDSVGGIIEAVTLRDEDGASILYMYHGDGSYGPVLKNGTITEVAKSSVVPGCPAGTDADCSDLGEFVVALASEGEEYSLFGSYAVIPKSNIGNFKDIGNRLSFAYPDLWYMFVSYPPKHVNEEEGYSEVTGYSEQEIKEIEAILSSFRIEN